MRRKKSEGQAKRQKSWERNEKQKRRNIMKIT
jgi:hypothetical protein